MASDDVEIDALISTFFDAFRTGPDLAQRCDALRAAFLPGAMIVKTCGDIAVYDVESFIAPRFALLSGGSLVDFSEWPEDGRLEIFGDIAAWFGEYRKSWIADGVPQSGMGMKSMQFVRTPGGWRISAAVWDDERA